MFKILIIAIIVSIGVVFAGDIPHTPEQKKVIAEIEFSIEDYQVKEVLRKSVSAMKGKPGGKKLTSFEYFGLSSKLKDWINYRWFIADTGFSRKWMKKIHELLVYMAKTKKYIKANQFSGNTKNAKYSQAIKYYNVAYKRFIDLIKKPVKVLEKVKRKARMKKVSWQRAMRKKHGLK